MKISERDKKLLCILGIVALFICAYYFGFKKLGDKNNALDNEQHELKAELSDLKTMAASEKTYKNKTAEFNENYDKEVKSYFNGYSQPYTIMFLKDLEDSVNAWISQAGLAETEIIYTFGDVVSTNPYAGSTAVYTSDYKGCKTTVTISYQATYSNFKKLIARINNNPYKCTIDSISSTYNAESDIVSGAMVLSMYAIIGSDREFKEPNVNNSNNGTGNIFNSEIFTPGIDMETTNGMNILVDYDVLVKLQPSSEETTAEISMKSDILNNATISSNSKDAEDMTLRFFGTEGNYFVQYSIGDKTFPADEFDAGSSFNPGNLLSVLVSSCEREGEDDTSKVNAKILNDTDLDLHIKIASEDGGDPRFVYEAVGENIYIYK